MNARENGGAGLPELNLGEDSRLIDIEPDDDFEPDDLIIMNMLSELGTDATATVRIYRQGPGGYQDMTYLTSCLPAEFSPSLIQDKFGAGEYRVHARSKNNSKLAVNRLLKVAARVDRQAEQQNILAPIQGQINALAGIIKDMATAMTQQRPAPVQTESRSDLIKEMMLMKDLFSGGRPGPDPLDMLTKVMAVSKEFAGLGGAGAEPDSMSVLMKALDTFAPILAAQYGQRVQPQGGQQMISAPAIQHDGGAGGGVDSEMPQGGGAIGSEDQMMMEMYIKMVLASARSDDSPQAFALMIAQKVPTETIDALLRPDDWFEKLQAISPAVAPYREWFSELRQMAFDILTDMENADKTDSTSIGGVNNVSAAGSNTNPS